MEKNLSLIFLVFNITTFIVFSLLFSAFNITTIYHVLKEWCIHCSKNLLVNQRMNNKLIWKRKPSEFLLIRFQSMPAISLAMLNDDCIGIGWKVSRRTKFPGSAVRKKLKTEVDSFSILFFIRIWETWHVFYIQSSFLYLDYLMDALAPLAPCWLWL